MTDPLIIILPERPPPLSACFTNARRFMKGGKLGGMGRRMTPRYIAWRGLCLLKVRAGGHISGAVVVDYQFARVLNPDGSINKVRRDLANYEKAVSDLLGPRQKGGLGIIDDDSFIQEIRMRWGGYAPVVITVASFRGEEGIATSQFAASFEGENINTPYAVMDCAP